MKGPNQDLDNVEQAFKDMTFQVGLKESTKKEATRLVEVLKEKASGARRVLVEMEKSFGATKDSTFMNVCLDHSICLSNGVFCVFELESSLGVCRGVLFGTLLGQKVFQDSGRSKLISE